MRAVSPLSLVCSSFGFYYVHYSCFHCLPRGLVDYSLACRETLCLVINLVSLTFKGISMIAGIFPT
jgi:hypothetical protein